MALSALTLLCAQPVWAAKKGPSVNMKVLGFIKPASCSVLLGDGGTFDYGKISADIIKEDAKGTDLGPTSTEILLKIDCGSTETQVGVDLTDDRSSSRVDGLSVYEPYTQKPYTSNETMFSLGASNSKNIGAYIASITAGAVDELSSYLGYVNLTSFEVTYASNQPRTLLANNSSTYNKITTWVAPEATSTPAASKLFTANLKVRATVNKASALDLSSGVQLDGRATLTVYYL